MENPNFSDNLSENSSMPSHFSDSYRNSLSDIISKVSNNPHRYSQNEKNVGLLQRRRWEPKIIKLIPPMPAYKLFNKKKFNYTVMPSLKEKYLMNMSLKSLKEFKDLNKLNNFNFEEYHDFKDYHQNLQDFSKELKNLKDLSKF